jgi:hypothetical protein
MPVQEVVLDMSKKMVFGTTIGGSDRLVSIWKMLENGY